MDEKTKELLNQVKHIEEIFGKDFEGDESEIINKFGLFIEGLETEVKKNNPTLDLEFLKINSDVVTPSYAYPSDSGMDLFSTHDEELQPFDRKLVGTGLKFNIPPNYEIQIRSKSGLALKQGLMVLNSPGTVDQGYLGEIKVILFNASNQIVKIQKGQKIAQAVLCPVVSGKWITLKEVTSFEEKDRSDNGFGSTGI